MTPALILGWSLQELSQCDDALAYGDSIHQFLWQGCFPAILTVTACRLCLKIFSIFLSEQ